MVGSLSDRTAELVFGVGRWMNPLYRAGRRLVSTTAFLHGMALTKNVDTHKAAAKLRNRGMVAFLKKEKEATSGWVDGSSSSCGVPNHVPTLLNFNRVIA
jgi:hypothetical protein